MGMDVLVVVGEPEVPERLALRARHVYRQPAGEPLTSLLGDLRSRIPRRVGVVGDTVAAGPVAAALHAAGLPVELLTDQELPPPLARELAGVYVRPLTDRGDPVARTLRAASRRVARERRAAEPGDRRLLDKVLTVDTLHERASHLRENPFLLAQEQLRKVGDTFGIDDDLIGVLGECKKSVEVAIPR